MNSEDMRFLEERFDRVYDKIDGIPALVNGKIEKHVRQCAAIRWRNWVIYGLATGGVGGGTTYGLVKFVSALIGG